MRLWPKLRAAARVYPYSQTEVASSNLLFAQFGRNNARCLALAAIRRSTNAASHRQKESVICRMPAACDAISVKSTGVEFIVHGSLTSGESQIDSGTFPVIGA